MKRSAGARQFLNDRMRLSKNNEEAEDTNCTIKSTHRCIFVKHQSVLVIRSLLQIVIPFSSACDTGFQRIQHGAQTYVCSKTRSAP